MEIVFPNIARMVESITVIMTDFFITYLPMRKGGMRFLFSDEMPDANGTTLRHGDAEQIGKHDDIDTIGACGKSFDSQHMNEKVITTCEEL